MDSLRQVTDYSGRSSKASTMYHSWIEIEKKYDKCKRGNNIAPHLPKWCTFIASQVGVKVRNMKMDFNNMALGVGSGNEYYTPCLKCAWIKKNILSLLTVKSINMTFQQLFFMEIKIFHPGLLAPSLSLIHI